ncbi:hypothetical protein DDV21_001790 [Streptococcus chenjunshii]|uniref:Uncharacterized protein n=1 Tax=Streptococcus chenjunshii TaxID=2173853 RepID=A0A372KJD4_9STRE|nr:hypothetical protein [Streptococcus chenjunshii]AXQ77890.1 hypothetical protein DDV21_001790 [Streptococcus chenjunshii]RFU50200.1 hypothetical protein DDV22_09855 [Streptococcus chenjunshii]RFU52379.1 hypothetical protein DDV23_09950 [Streptococcus chenjunshii]
MATIRLKRGTKGANMFRKFKVFVNDSCVGKIKRGESLDISVPEGTYSVYCKIDWEQSNTLTVNVPATGVDLLVNSKGATESAFRSLIPFDGKDKYLVLVQQ